MKQYTPIILIIIFIATVFVVVKVKQKSNAKNFIEKIREQNKAGLDSLQNAINYENNLNSRIKKSITDSDLNTAYSLIDSLPTFGKINSTLLYRGMIFEKQKKYKQAIEEYTALINAEPYPIAFAKRAEIYTRINNMPAALIDFKKAAALNYDYNFKVASVFNLINKKDSALKYYQIYLEHYPNDTFVQLKIKILKGN